MGSHRDPTICDWHRWGDGITLRCTTHGGLFCTKNIDHIGARGIFWVKVVATDEGFACAGGTAVGCRLVHECPEEQEWATLLAGESRA